MRCVIGAADHSSKVGMRIEALLGGNCCCHLRLLCSARSQGELASGSYLGWCLTSAFLAPPPPLPLFTSAPQSLTAVIVVPPGLLKIGDTAAETYKAGESASLEKDTLFFFAGNIDFNWLAYSLGVRQRLYIETRDRPAFDFNGKSVAEKQRPYKEAVRKSVFCLAPAGGGWGQRLIDGARGRHP